MSKILKRIKEARRKEKENLLKKVKGLNAEAKVGEQEKPKTLKELANEVLGRDWSQLPPNPFLPPPRRFSYLPPVGVTGPTIPREYFEQEMEKAMQKIDQLQRTLQSHRQPTVDPFESRRMRSALEKIDYTEWFSDEEDGLEENYKGWPISKPRVIF